MPRPALPAVAWPAALTPVVIRLLKGVVYRQDDEALWNSLLEVQASVQDYLKVLNLQLRLNEGEGYAYLRIIEDAGEDAQKRPPRLVTRHRLSFRMSLVLAMLRRRLVEFETAGGETRLVLTRDEVFDIVRVYLPEESNEVAMKKRLTENLNGIARMGFLRRLPTERPHAQPSYEVRTIIKEFVDAQWLADLEQRLAALSGGARSH